jgi:hypothetical protein
MDELLKAIADYVASYQLAERAGKDTSDPFFRGWNDGVATAATQLLDDNDNKAVREAIEKYVNSLYQ